MARLQVDDDLNWAPSRWSSLTPHATCFLIVERPLQLFSPRGGDWGLASYPDRKDAPAQQRVHWDMISGL